MEDSQMEATSTQRRGGRPRGSKNKPKPPPEIIAPNPFPRSDVLEISPGSNIIELVVRFGHSLNANVTITSGSGMISNFVLRSMELVAPLMIFPGSVNLLNMNGTFLHLTSSPSFGITFAGKDGKVIGGSVSGSLTAHTRVFLAVTVFIHPTSVVAHDASVQSVNGSRQLAGISDNIGHNANRIAGSSILMNNSDEGFYSGNFLNYRYESPNIVTRASTSSLKSYQQPNY